MGRYRVDWLFTSIVFVVIVIEQNDQRPLGLGARRLRVGAGERTGLGRI